MQTSVVNYKDLNFEFRIDAEYYRAEVLRSIKLLDRKDNAALSDLASFVIGPFGSTVTVDQYVPQSDFRYVRNKDINDFLISDDEPAYIAEHVYKALPQFHIKENDLLITVVGTLGKVAIATKKDTLSIFSCKSTIIRPKKIDPFYLLTYLNSSVGQLFSLRGVRGAIQQGLNLSDLKEIKVFLPSEDFQKNIRSIGFKAFSFTTKSRYLYSQAEQILLSELGLLNWKPKHCLSFVKRFSDTQASGRIDAECFQPIYEEVVKAVKSSRSHASLGDIVSIKKCIEPGSEAYQDSGIPFLRVSNLSKFGINTDNQQFLSETLYDTLKKYQPKKGEILLSKDATPGIAYYLKDTPAKMVPSGGILRLTLKDAERLYPEYLTLVLNSIIVQKQIERDSGGSIINHWLVDQVKSTLIPILSVSAQKQIAERVDQSFSDREQSKRLLDIAKRGVEMAIEKGEKEAQGWIDLELKKSGIPQAQF
jgi:type I restriction enzyme, S subunit